MKRVLSIGLILIMSLQCFFKLGVITYFHMNREYIAEVLCLNKEEPITTCYGQCFLDRNLDLADDTNADDGALPLGKLKIDFPVFIISESFYSFQTLLKSERVNSYYRAGSSSVHRPAPFHPPAHLS